MEKIDVFGGELSASGYPMLGAEYYGKEKLLGAYKNDDDKCYMITTDNEGNLGRREFLQKHDISEGPYGNLSVSTTIYAQLEAKPLPEYMSERIRIAMEKFEQNREELEEKGLTFMHFAVEKPMKINGSTIHGFNDDTYDFLSELHRKDPNMSFQQSIDKRNTEIYIEQLQKGNSIDDTMVFM